MKHIPTFEDFVNESYNKTQTKYKTQNVDWDDIAPGNYIADGPNVGEVSRVISNTKKGFTLKFFPLIVNNYIIIKQNLTKKIK